MICVASSKHRSMRLARMWNSRSPGVATAWREPARISRNGWSSAGRGCAEQPVPGVGTNPHHAGKIGLDVAGTHRAQQRRRGRRRMTARRCGGADRVDRDDQEDRGARQAVAPPAAGQSATLSFVRGWPMMELDAGVRPPIMRKLPALSTTYYDPLDCGDSPVARLQRSADRSGRRSEHRLECRHEAAFSRRAGMAR